MNAAHRKRHAAQLRSSGFEDGPALTVQSTDGDIPHGRELSFAWLAGTVVTGLTSVLLMGAALYIAFEGRDTFSTPYRALHISAPAEAGLTPTDISSKSERARPVTQTRSELEVIEAGIRELIDGRAIIRNQPFIRLRATLATAATALSEDVPAYDPVAILNATQPIEAAQAAGEGNTDIYGADVEGEVAVRLAAMPMTFAPPAAIDDALAGEFVRLTLESAYSDIDAPVLAYAASGPTIRELGEAEEGSLVTGVAENVTVMPKTTRLDEAQLGRTERIFTVKERSPLTDVMRRNGFNDVEIKAISATLKNVFTRDLRPGERLRILLGPANNGTTLSPYRMSIYAHDSETDVDLHAVTVALTDKGQYVVSMAPPEMEFPEEDTEEVNVANLPSIYRSIWETGRKHDLSDETITRIIGMFAYDLDMTKRIAPGDAIEILKTAPDAEGRQDLLYVALTLGSTKRELYRFVTPDGVADFYDPSGETGKRFLVRRPLEGGGTLRSRFGYRIHPIFKSRKLHTGVDLAARTGTPIYAAGDGVVQLVGWQSGYGNKIEVQHVNGYETAYGHMSRFADGIKPGTRVRQGQIIGYVGSTGYSTGPHLHFEILINGNLVDPLSVKLPRENSLADQYRSQFGQVVAQINDLMQKDPAPVAVAASE
ncbi:M23 family metallopeptidase [Devosia nitrariae]|uniref:Peptidase M24 n=1 Tax=Devosia nitrariae TaxID=2071872 RepID=A0ABQ5W306_9HYPH|nr:M23 family metallopeptidase [Devosia nitrariae]GLQ54076.1 peptidase M24 [Devosia nitrariae]